MRSSEGFVRSIAEDVDFSSNPRVRDLPLIQAELAAI
jgi:hypothetical protein